MKKKKPSEPKKLKKPARSKKYYAVVRGHGETPNIYTTWAKCKEMTDGYPGGAIFKKFQSLDGANQYIQVKQKELEQKQLLKEANKKIKKETVPQFKINQLEIPRKEINIYLRATTSYLGGDGDMLNKIDREVKGVAILQYKTKFKYVKLIEKGSTDNEIMLKCFKKICEDLKSPCEINVFSQTTLGLKKGIKTYINGIKKKYNGEITFELIDFINKNNHSIKNTYNTFNKNKYLILLNELKEHNIINEDQFEDLNF